MTRACHTAVRMAVGDVFSDKDIDDFLLRMGDRARRVGRAQPTLDERQAIREAAQAMTKEEIFGALSQKRLQLAAEAARTARRARFEAMPDSMDEAQKLAAYDVGSEKQGRFTSASVDAEGRARSMSLWGQVQLGLQQQKGLIDRVSNPWGLMNRGVDRKIAQEMARLNGAGDIQPTGDEGALHAARVFNAALEQGRVMQNEQGAWIDRLTGYVARQSHDRLKVSGGMWRELGEVTRRIKAGDGKASLDFAAARQRAAMRAFGAWRDHIAPLLDPKTFDGLADQDVSLDDADKFGHPLGADASLNDKFLYRVWYDIATGRHEALSGADDLGDFKPPSSVARKVSASRVLHFKDPDSWIDYNEKYGQGNLFSAVMSQLDRAGKNTALMQRWGPAPEAARSAEIERLASSARARGDPGVDAKLRSAKMQANFDAVNGMLNTPENLRLGLVASTTRTIEATMKLGGMVLSKATDLPMTSHTFARAGAGFLAGYEGAFRGILRLQSEDARHAAELMDVGARSFAGHMAGQVAMNDGVAGWASWASRMTYKLGLFDFVNEGVRRGAAEMLSRHLGQQSALPYDAIHQGLRETLERFGIDGPMWDEARATTVKGDDGKAYFTLDRLAQGSDTDLRFRTLIHNVLDDTVSEPRARERAVVTSGLRSGTIFGEAARSLTQFHGFIRTILGRHLAPAATGYAGYQPVALMAHFIVGTAIAGFLSMQAKQIAAGRMPRSLINDDGTPQLATWGAALAQGGGLGIYGDFLFGEENRQGLPATLSAFGGPLLSDAEKVASMVRQAVHGEGDHLPGEVTNFATTHIPLVNLWYTRVALDYMILWRLQEDASPGYLERYEQNVRAKQHTDFIVHPTNYFLK